MHSIVTTFRGAVIKVEVANFCAAMDTLIDQDGLNQVMIQRLWCWLIELLNWLVWLIEIIGLVSRASLIRIN